MADHTVLAVDMGGTKIAVGIVDPDGRVVVRSRTPTPIDSDAEVVWSALLEAIDALPDVDRVAAVGVGCGGPMVWPAGRVSPLNIPAWRGFPLRDRIQQRFPDLPVRVHNDAACFAAAEHWRGAGRSVDDMLGMVVATGVGAGLVMDGRLVDGRTGNAGHIGHVVVDSAGPPCTCGGRGCLEAIARGPALAAWAVQNGWRASGDGSARALADDARGGDPIAVAAFARGGRAIGIALASTASLLDLALVVIGGGVVQAGELLLAPVRRALGEHSGVEFLRDLKVVPSGLGLDAGLVGAAALVLDSPHYWSSR
ncbi:MAG TPA: ROK family protein [Acidothermaceae bacterium]|jgi:glucokinase|nr:ROK family protein [Acidothermaceae bacterium]